MSTAPRRKRKTIRANVRIRSAPVVLSTDAALELVRSAGYIALDPLCRCREERSCKRYPSSFACLYLGPGSEGLVASGVAKPISVDEAVGHVQKARDLGLVHMVLWTSEMLRSLGPGAGRALELCACCPCCCISRRTGDGQQAYVDGIVGLGLARAEGACDGCGACAGVCPLNAITLEDGHPLVNADRCKGCGRCARACSQGAIRVHPLEMVPGYSDGWTLTPAKKYYDAMHSVVR